MMWLLPNGSKVRGLDGARVTDSVLSCIIQSEKSPDKTAALSANLKVQALPGVICSKDTVTAVVEGGATICR
jgi:hypothetical protein